MDQRRRFTYRLGGSVFTTVMPFDPSPLAGELAALREAFPGWEISYRVIADGLSSAMPYGAAWTATRDAETVTAGTSADLARSLRKTGQKPAKPRTRSDDQHQGEGDHQPPAPA